LTHPNSSGTIQVMSQATMRSPAEARAWLQRHGVTISEWARRHGFKPAVVSALLSERTRGCWGEAHDAAIMLGLRPAPADDEAHPLEPSSDPRGIGGHRAAPREGAHMT
jgi:gp16 family phage-associated protein